MEERLKKRLIEGARVLGVDLASGAVEAFSAYLDELVRWSRKISLVSDAAPDVVVERHFLDSLTPVGLLREMGVTSLLDLGAGAGFPGIPVKIAMPEVELTLMDSVGKKVHFVRRVIRALGLTGARAVHARAEGAEPAGGVGPVDCVISRAFASLEDFLELSAPYLAPGGAAVAMKGPKAKEEGPGRTEGFTLVEAREVEVPFTGRTTTLVVCRKG